MSKKSPSPPQSPNRVRADLRRMIEANLQTASSRDAATKDLLRYDPNSPQRKKESDRSKVQLGLRNLQDILNRCIPHIANIKTRYLESVRDQTRESACYLLFCKVLQTFEGIFLLAERGFGFEGNVLLRVVRECLDLIALFLIEGGKNSNLRIWFAGEIIDNKIARHSVGKWINKDQEVYPVEELKAGIYTAYSHYQHVSYGAISECIDPFEHDFDFQQTAGFHHTVSGTLPSASDAVKSTIIHLKHFYMRAEDTAIFKELDRILQDFAP